MRSSSATVRHQNIQRLCDSIVFESPDERQNLKVLSWLSVLPYPYPVPWTKELYRQQSLNVVFIGHFCLGRCSNFVGSESGQKQSVKLLHAEDGLQQNSTPPHPTAKHCLYILYVYFGKGGRGRGGQREMVEGQQFTKEVENTYLQSTNSIKHQ